MPRLLSACALLLLALLALPEVAHAQATGTITGRVTDASDGQPLITANVVVIGTATGAATDLSGNYTISGLQPGTYTIEARFTGFIPQRAQVTVAAGRTATQNFALQPDLTGIEEVVVTGALSERARSRSEVGVSRLNAEEFTERVRYQDISQLLNGKIAGVNVQAASGNVGGGIRFNVRSGGGLAGGQPLIFIDGVRIDNSQFTGFGVGGQNLSALSTLNPSDIANIDVLKGPAAAALYGTDAAQGVVLITTRRGQISRSGDPTFAINYNGTTGANTQQFRYDETTAWRTFENANRTFVNGAIQEHILGVSGGSGVFRYFAQGNMRDEDGIQIGNTLQRRGIRANFDAFPRQDLTFSFSGNYVLNSVARPQNDNNVQGWLGNTILAPTPYNFLDSLAIAAIADITRTNQYTASFETRYTPIAGLTLRAQAGIDAGDARQDQTYPPGFNYPGITTLGERRVFTRENDQVTFDASARYAYSITPSLQASSSLGLQGFDRRVRTFNFTIRQFATDLITSTGSGTQYQGTGEFFQNERQLGLLYDQSLDYQDTYLLSFGARYDVASSIGAEAPDVIYPFVRGALRLDRFSFAPQEFALLKLRAAYGQSGVLPGSFQSIPILYGANAGGNGAGAVPFQIGNSEIKPERIGEFEIGLDAELVGGLASVEATYYVQDARDSIVLIPNAPSSGLTATAQPFNVGAISGRGFELALNVSPVRSRNFTADLSTLFNFQTNKVRDIGDGQPIFDGFSVNVIKPDLPRSAFYMPVVRGARFNDEGRYIGIDVNPNERTFLGIPYPKYNGSFSGNFTFFQDVSLYALFDYALGLSVLNSTRQFQAQFGNLRERSDLAVQLGLQPPRDGIQPLTVGSPEYREAANRYARTDGSQRSNFIEDADYLKLREVSVRFDVSRYLAQAPGFQGVRSAALSLAGRNLWTTTKYTGIDPEVNFAGSASLSQGQDFLTLQQPRTFTATLSLGI